MSFHKKFIKNLSAFGLLVSWLPMPVCLNDINKINFQLNLLHTEKNLQVRIHTEGNSKIMFVLLATIFPCTGFACISVLYTFFIIHCTGNSTSSIGGALKNLKYGR